MALPPLDAFTFPINLAPMGLNLELNPGTLHRITTVVPVAGGDLGPEAVANPALGVDINAKGHFFRANLPNVTADNLRANPDFGGRKGKFQPDEPGNPSRIRFADGRTFVVIQGVGEGAYGQVAFVKEIDAGGHVFGPDYALKRQHIYTPDVPGDLPYTVPERTILNNAKLFTFVKEAIIQFILYDKTRDPVTQLSAYVPAFHKIAIMGDNIYFLTERMTNNLRNILNIHFDNRVPGNVEIKAEYVAYCYRDIVPKLRNLFDACQYTHGDFKDDNLMYRHDTGEWKLIDFGFSRIVIEGHVIDTQSWANGEANNSRDMTMFTISLSGHMGFQDVAHWPRSSRIAYLVNYMLYGILSPGWCDHSLPGCGNPDAHWMDWLKAPWAAELYEALNYHTNVAGDFESIISYINWITNEIARAAPPPDALPLHPALPALPAYVPHYASFSRPDLNIPAAHGAEPTIDNGSPPPRVPADVIPGHLLPGAAPAAAAPALPAAAGPAPAAAVPSPGVGVPAAAAAGVGAVVGNENNNVPHIPPIRLGFCERLICAGMIAVPIIVMAVGRAALGAAVGVGGRRRRHKSKRNRRIHSKKLKMGRKGLRRNSNTRKMRKVNTRKYRR